MQLTIKYEQQITNIMRVNQRNNRNYKITSLRSVRYGIIMNSINERGK